MDIRYYNQYNYIYKLIYIYITSSITYCNNDYRGTTCWAISLKKVMVIFMKFECQYTL